jgi:SprB repeat
MAAFNYNLSITGDCSGGGFGAIGILPTGGTMPYTIEWISPYFPPDIAVIGEVVQSGLYSNVYSIRLSDSSLPTNNEFYVNIPVSSGVCCQILSVQKTTCGSNNGSVTATSTSDYSSTYFYLYSSGNTLITNETTNTGSIVFGGLSAGTYYIVAQDIGGCTGRSQSFIIEPSNSFDYGLYIVPNSSCGGSPAGKIYITGQTGQSPYTYLWSNGSTDSVVTGLTAGSYTVTVTDYFGCSLIKEALVTSIPPVGLGYFSAITPSCFTNDGAIVLNITGGTAPYYYSASTGDVVISYSEQYVLSGLSPGSYSFQVTDAGLCSFIAGTQLLSPQGMSSVQVVGTNSTCSSTDGSILVSVQNGSFPYTYTLVYPNGNSDSYSTNETSYLFSNLGEGTYSVFVQDLNGCSYSQVVYIMTSNSFTINVSNSNTTCGISNGSATIIVSGGSTPYTYYLDGIPYVVSTTQTATTIGNISYGTHSVSVTDGNGCTQTNSFFVNNSYGVDFSLYPISCGSGDEGTITAFISSGVPPFTYYWSNNVIGNPQQIYVSGLTAGTYSLTVIDSNGCTQSKSTEIICGQSYQTYELYVMGSEDFSVTSGTKLGLLQMLNDGYEDLVSGNTSCSMVSAQFKTKISVTPVNIFLTDIFYTSYGLNDAPQDSLWYDSIKNLLYTISGVQEVTINPLTNEITIRTVPGSPCYNQEITVEMILIYDIMCIS